MSTQTPSSEPRPPAERSDRVRRTEDLLGLLSRTEDPNQRRQIEELLVLANMGVADSLVRRYVGRGVAEEDLQQVAYLALLRVIRNFDDTAGHSFLAYAVPSIRGELRRHFRDHGWTVRPPRRLQELQWHIAKIESSLASELGRQPRPSEFAARLGAPLDEVEEALASRGCFTPSSLDAAPGQGPASGPPLGEMISDEDSGRAQEHSEALIVLAPLVRRLSKRDRRILLLRFFEGCTQQEIADDIGVTQMQVSRLLRRIFADLRHEIEGDDDQVTS